MEQAIEHRGDGCGVAEELAPVLDGPVRRDERRGAFVPTHDDFQEILGGRVWELAHAEIVDDEQWHAGDGGHVVLARAAELRLGELFE